MSVKPQPFHAALWDHYGRLSSLLDLFVSQSSPLVPLHSLVDDHPT